MREGELIVSQSTPPSLFPEIFPLACLCGEDGHPEALRTPAQSEHLRDYKRCQRTGNAVRLERRNETPHLHN